MDIKFEITVKIILLQLLILFRISKNGRCDLYLKCLTVIRLQNKKNSWNCTDHSSNKRKHCWYLLHVSIISNWIRWFNQTNIDILSSIYTIFGNLAWDVFPWIFNQISFLFYYILKRPNTFVSLNSIIRDIKVCLYTYLITKYDIIGVLQIVGNVIFLIFIDNWIRIV